MKILIFLAIFLFSGASFAAPPAPKKIAISDVQFAALIAAATDIQVELQLVRESHRSLISVIFVSTCGLLFAIGFSSHRNF
jgi:hypothetical protein